MKHRLCVTSQPASSRCSVSAENQGKGINAEGFLVETSEQLQTLEPCRGGQSQ
jgi:hypothetical protein